jgi:hypothetical protein
MRVSHLLVAFAFGVLAAGCGSQGVGDPCNPRHPMLSGQPNEEHCAAGGPDAACFVGGEIYIETRSLQCRTRVCMVYKWDEANRPDQRPARVFCTCKCGGTGEASSLCDCPEDFSCTTAFVTGDPGIQGSYCVRNEAIGDAGAQ